MKKIYAFALALTVGAVTANAEENANVEAFSATEVENTTDAAATVENNADKWYAANTDEEMAEKHWALYEPKEKPSQEDKDFKYWAGTVASRIKVTGYAQGGYEAEFKQGGNNSNTFNLSRVILMVGANITPKFYAFFMHEFKSGKVMEYYLEYRPFNCLNIRLGQWKKNFTMENLLSPTILESFSMSQGVYFLNGSDPLIDNTSGRDLGIQVSGKFANNHLYYVLQVVNGGQVNTADKNNQKNVIGKLEYSPNANWRIGITGQKGYGYAMNHSVYNPDIKVGETYVQDRWSAGVEWKSKKTGTDYYKDRCITGRTEVLGGRDGNAHSFGAYSSWTIPVYKQLDVVAEADYFNYNTDLHLKKTQLTVGAQCWVFKKCRLRAQYMYAIKSDAMKAIEGGNAHKLMAQVQVAF